MLHSTHMINVEIKRNPNENTTSVIRRFSKRVKGSGIVQRVRNIGTYERADSKYKRKQATLKAIERRVERERLKKLGKITDERQGSSK